MAKPTKNEAFRFSFILLFAPLVLLLMAVHENDGTKAHNPALSAKQKTSPVPSSVATERPIVGAIRWDAWHGDASEVGLMVEKTLAPKHWHYRLPFFAKVLGENTVEVRGHTQAIMDQEIAYAHAAGLDFWAFVIYPEDYAMSLGLNLYLASQNKDKINFCINLQGGWESRGGTAQWPEKVSRYVQYFKEPTYQKVLDGRPIVFLYDVDGLVHPQGFTSWDEARGALERLRHAAQTAGLLNPYIVAQGWNPETLKKQAQLLELDAVSAYASSAGAKRGTYADLARHTETWWDSFKSTGLPVVPLATAGWDMRPRIETPVPWVQGGDSEQYYEPPTPEELASHLTKALEWCQNNPTTAEARVVLIYAWNEFDEGGWLCPTVFEGTARLDAIGKILVQK